MDIYAMGYLSRVDPPHHLARPRRLMPEPGRVPARPAGRSARLRGPGVSPRARGSRFARGPRKRSRTGSGSSRVGRGRPGCRVRGRGVSLARPRRGPGPPVPARGGRCAVPLGSAGRNCAPPQAGPDVYVATGPSLSQARGLATYVEVVADSLDAVEIATEVLGRIR